MLKLFNQLLRPHSHWAAAIIATLSLVLVSRGFLHASSFDSLPQRNLQFEASQARGFAIADFDGDGRPDLASVELGWRGPQNYSIDLRLTAGLRQSIAIAAPEGGLQLRVTDVNGDNFPDLVVSTSWTDRPVAVLLNDGSGNFIRSDPATFPATFQKLGNSISSRADDRADTAATLLPRFPLQDGQRGGWHVALRNSVGYLGATVAPTPADANRFSSFGRAPPSLAAHSRAS
jgi:hypothetical protein